jgi:hypothetical protein
VCATGRAFATRKVIVACGPWAGPVLSSLLGVRVPTLQPVQCTVMYFAGKREGASVGASVGGHTAAAGAAEGAIDFVAAQPVVIHYGIQPLWTSTVGDRPGERPLAVCVACSEDVPARATNGHAAL